MNRHRVMAAARVLGYVVFDDVYVLPARPVRLPSRTSFSTNHATFCGEPPGDTRMTQDLTGKTILVTGAASGIGQAIATFAAKAGVDSLVLTDRDSEGLATVGEALAGPRIKTVCADLAAPEAADVIFDTIAALPRLDGLVNAAGITTRASFVDGTTEVWDRVFAVNARAPFLLMSRAIDRMRQQGGGSIVNIQSMNAHCGAPELAIYSASKGALQTLTKNAANAHLKDRVRVNGINLGWTWTPAEHNMQSNILGHGDDWAGRAAKTSPLGRLIQPEDAARMALYLLSDDSAPMTGMSLDLEQTVVGAPA
jgi:NAD(P)-dependent dehydrogenase (short-subunit alcohol dehydrogenase family)